MGGSEGGGEGGSEGGRRKEGGGRGDGRERGERGEWEREGRVGEGGERRRTVREVIGQRNGVKELHKCVVNLHQHSWRSCSQTR